MNSLKKSFALLAVVSAATVATSQANAVLPAVELDKAAQTASVATPLIPTVVPSVNTPVVLNPAPTNNVLATTPSSFSGMGATSNNAALLQTKITASLVGADGTLIPVTPQTKLATGNIVEYHGYITNTSPERVRTMKVTMPIPANMELVGKPSPEPVYGSNNGVQFNYMPTKISIGGVIQDAPMSYYKSVRWDIAGLGLNEVAEVKYQVRVK